MAYKFKIKKTMPNNIKLEKSVILPVTIAYFTCRNDPKIEWFFNSLNRELKGDWSNIHILIIDYHFQFKPIERFEEFKKYYELYTTNVKHISPKPSPVQGKYRVTQKNYFAASNARNTAFIHCKTPYIVCIDDLTVLKEGWFDVVNWGNQYNYVLFGSYAKVKNLECNLDGSYKYDLDKVNLDSRYNSPLLDNNFATKVSGSWLYGCSFAMPLDMALDMDGFDEAADGQGAEDSYFGIRIGRVTNNIYYSKLMHTLEDDDLHFTPGNVHFIRESILITEDTIFKNKIGIMSDHAAIQIIMESKSKYPLTSSKLIEIKNLYENENEEEVNIKLASDFNNKIDWRDGKLWSSK